MKTKRFLQAAVVLMALLVPATALAFGYDSGPFYDELEGSVLDPAQTRVHVVPPKGGAVMLYRNGKVKGWFMHPGVVTVKPGRVYGVLATRGTAMVFNAGVAIRPGVTEIVFDGSRPRVAYFPNHAHSHHARAHHRARHHSRRHASGHRAHEPTRRAQRKTAAKPVVKPSKKARVRLHRAIKPRKRARISRKRSRIDNGIQPRATASKAQRKRARFRLARRPR